MSAPESHYPHRYADPLGALRLRLAPTFASDSLAGVWWPYSRDLTREGPHLVDSFPSGRGRIDRLVYSPDEWDVVAQEVFTSHGRIKVGFLPPDRAGGLLLRLVGSGIIRLRVVWHGEVTPATRDFPTGRGRRP
jgi:hypothetical protein